MASMPVVCMNCGYSFDMPNFIGGSGGARIIMTGNTTRCQRCQQNAEILDGVYQYANNAITTVSGGVLSPAQIAKLSGLRVEILSAHHAGTHQISDDVVEAVTAVSPELGAVAKLLKQQKFGLAALILVMFIWLKQCGAESGGIHIDMSQHVTNVTEVTQVYNAPSGNVDNSKHYNAGSNTKPASDGTESKKH